MHVDHMGAGAGGVVSVHIPRDEGNGLEVLEEREIPAGFNKARKEINTDTGHGLTRPFRAQRFKGANKSKAQVKFVSSLGKPNTKKRRRMEDPLGFINLDMDASRDKDKESDVFREKNSFGSER
ncbi:hypothetical protein Hanom_Chr11g00996311 [Helianthus anomalus]